MVPLSAKRHVKESCIYSRNALKSLARTTYLCPYRSSVSPGGQGVHKEDKEGEIRRDSPETQQFVSSSRLQAGSHSKDLFWLIF